MVTTWNSLPAFNSVERNLIGFDDIFGMFRRAEELQKSTDKTFPPYSIKKVTDTTYVVELAIAGFSKDDVDITVDGDLLQIKGEVKENDNDTYIYRGIAKRAFTKSFTLGEMIEVRGADMVNGVLEIRLEKVIPEHKRPVKISIGGGKRFTDNQLLNG